MISTILVATDGSEACAASERFGVTLAARLKARLMGISVVEDRLARGFQEDGLGVTPPPMEAVTAYLKSRAEAACRRLAERAHGEGVESSCDVMAGIADDRIVERGQQADLTVVGRDGQDAAYRSGLIGSTVNGVIRKIARPALVVPSTAQLAGPIVLAFDSSPGSRIGANLAVQLATRLGEPIHVFVDSKDKGRALARFEEVRAIVGSLPVPVREISSTLGRPDVKIVDSAREVRASLIVMGAYGRNRITDYFLGSNSAAVVRTSPIAVLLAR
ncbi:MAG: universal stress protein [Myxococcales bacterium]|nr:universal stress protein [Myxococcales bacterium]MDH5305574.1 universal stress protein [Myxococcales bacterium]MDH5567654.1 universal stress protein [Myxococcales bacterium]